jgi:hypothetical protein
MRVQAGRTRNLLAWIGSTSTAPKKAVILTQVGHFYFGAMVQFYSGANNRLGGPVPTVMGMHCRRIPEAVRVLVLHLHIGASNRQPRVSL